MQAWSEEEIHRTLEKIRKLSVTDLDFRDLALSNPTAAIATVTSIPLPEGYQVQFVDNSGPLKSFVLPDPVNDVEELTDVELEAIAGGVDRHNNVNTTNVVPA